MTKAVRHNSSILQGKTIIFSGGSGYLGSVMIDHLLKCGAKVINIGRRRPEVLSKYSETSQHYSVDFYETELLSETITEILIDLAKVDILINNSFDFSQKTGFNHSNGRIENLTKKTFLKGIESGLYWPLLCSQIVGKKMKSQNHGNIINISSLYASLVADYRIYKGRDIFNPVIYPISKHGLLGLTKYIASFWSEYNIRCNCLSPGSFPNIEVNKAKDNSMPNKVQDEDFLKILEQKCSLGRFGIPSDLLSSLEFLCSDKSSYMTGANIVVDGGWSVI